MQTIQITQGAAGGEGSQENTASMSVATMKNSFILNTLLGEGIIRQQYFLIFQHSLQELSAAVVGWHKLGASYWKSSHDESSQMDSSSFHESILK